MTAAEARKSTPLRARVQLAASAGPRAIADYLDGYHAQSSTAERIRVALESEGVDLSTIPVRTPGELAQWRRDRQPPRLAKGAVAMPEGYALEQCGCGREYPRMQSEAEGKCPKCWRKAFGEMRDERDALQAEMSARAS